MTRLTSRQREDLYDLCRGEAEFPTCNICGLPIMPGQKWDVSHNPYLPGALGGEVDGVAHRRCNRRHNNLHDTPLVAKVKRLRQKHIGAYVRPPGRRLPGSRDSDIKIRINRPPVWRDSGRPFFK